MPAPTAPMTIKAVSNLIIGWSSFRDLKKDMVTPFHSRIRKDSCAFVAKETYSASLPSSSSLSSSLALRISATLAEMASNRGSRDLMPSEIR